MLLALTTNLIKKHVSYFSMEKEGIKKQYIFIGLVVLALLILYKQSYSGNAVVSHPQFTSTYDPFDTGTPITESYGSEPVPGAALQGSECPSAIFGKSCGPYKCNSRGCGDACLTCSAEVYQEIRNVCQDFCKIAGCVPRTRFLPGGCRIIGDANHGTRQAVGYDFVCECIPLPCTSASC